MTDSVNIRALSLDAILEITENGGYSHKVIGAVLDKYQYLSKQERAFFTRLTEGTIQRMIEMDYIIDLYSKVKTDKMKPVIRGILRMGVYQLIYMDSVPASAACNEAVKLASKRGFLQLKGFVNGVLRNISRNAEDVSYPDMSVRYSMPQWIVDKWTADYGEEQTEKILSSFLCDAPITIRTNLLKTTPKELKTTLENEGVTVQDIEGVPYAFAISGYDYLGALASFNDGLFYVQDISSMRVADLAAPREGAYCIDVCAAPGGKSIHLAGLIGQMGTVEARDISDDKVLLISDNIKRQGITNVKAVKWDATIDDPKVHGMADVLIADLPCSGLGTLRKKSDIKYRITEADIEGLAALQRQILDVVSAYVKPGGTLIYSTCTIDKAENEENVKWFLENHSAFSLDGMEQIFPGAQIGDGFFISRLIKKF